MTGPIDSVAQSLIDKIVDADRCRSLRDEVTLADMAYIASLKEPPAEMKQPPLRITSSLFWL